MVPMLAMAEGVAMPVPMAVIVAMGFIMGMTLIMALLALMPACFGMILPVRAGAWMRVGMGGRHTVNIPYGRRRNPFRPQLGPGNEAGK